MVFFFFSITLIKILDEVKEKRKKKGPHLIQNLIEVDGDGRLAPKVKFRW